MIEPRAKPPGTPAKKAPSPTASEPSGDDRQWRAPIRAIILGLLALPFTCYWAQDQEVDRIFSLMIPPVVVALALVVVNVLVMRLSPRLALSQGELLVFYGMQAVACAMASEWVDFTNFGIYNYALFTDGETRAYALPYLSHWLFFTNATGLAGFAHGGQSFPYFLDHLGIWWPKILAWTALAGVLSFGMLCINALMLDQWVNREKFTFPIAQLPIAMTERGGNSPIWKSRILWTSFGLIFGIDMLNGFHFLYPSLPYIPVRFLSSLGIYDDVSNWFSQPPWNQTGWTPIGIFPFIAAIGLLMPTDLLFSCLVFFLFRKIEQLVAASMGYPTGLFGGASLVPAPPYFTEQSWGAFLGLFVGAVWAARPYLLELWHDIKSGARGDQTRISPRMAFAGFLVSLVVLGLFGIAIGLPFIYVVLYMLIFIVFSVALSRLRAQLGAPTHEMCYMGPDQLFVDFHGTQGVSAPVIVNSVASFHFLNRLHRTDPMPNQLEAMYLGDRAKIHAGWVFGALIVATLCGSIIGHLARIWVGYHIGPQDSLYETMGAISSLMQNPRSPNAGGIAAIVLGFLIVLGLNALRFRYVGFPLHPAGFALAMNFGLDYYWFGLILALIAKVSAQRYSGLRGIQTLRMAAFGLILGEFAAETIWAIYSMTHHDQMTYTVSINGKMAWNQ